MMLRIATHRDLKELSEMLKSMIEELMPLQASTNMEDYTNTIKSHLNNDRVYVDSKYRGFNILEDGTESITPSMKRIIVSRVYIKPQYRNSMLYGKMLKRIDKDYPGYDILGMTEINSPHIPILDKHQELIAKVYRRKK